MALRMLLSTVAVTAEKARSQANNGTGWRGHQYDSLICVDDCRNVSTHCCVVTSGQVLKSAYVVACLKSFVEVRM